MYNKSIPTSYPKVSNRQIRREALKAITRAEEAVKLLVAVLAQQGGEVTITTGTLDQVRSDMDFKVEPGEKPNELKIIALTSGD